MVGKGKEKEWSQNSQPMHDGKSPGPLAIQLVLCNRKWACMVCAIYRVSQKNLATISLKVSVGGWGVSRSSPAISQFVSAQFQLHRACHKLLAREIP